MPSHLLVASHGQEVGIALTKELEKSSHGFRVDSSEIPAETLSKMAGGGYDALVCCAENAEDLGEVARFRKASPDLEIVLVSSVHDPAFRKKALLAGATSVVPSARDLAVVADFLDVTLRMSQAARALGKQTARAGELSRDIHGLIQDHRALIHAGFHASRAPRRSRLLPLLVGDDPEDAFRLDCAFDKADVFAPLPILRSTEEAVAYLNGDAPFADRNRYPLPNIVLLNLRPSAMSSLEMLGWIRGQSHLHRIPVVVPGDGVDPESLRRAYGLQANSYLVKPGSFEELVEMVRAIDLYWSSINIGQELI